MQKKGIKSILGRTVLILLAVIESSFIKKIPVETVRNGVLLLFTPFKNSVKALTDKDPNNKDQLTQIWRDFMASSGLVEYSNIEISRIALKIQNEHFKNAILAVSVPITNMYQLLGDNNPDDAVQLAQKWKEWIHSPDSDPVALNLIAPFLDRYLDKELADIIINLIEEALANRHTQKNEEGLSTKEMVLYRK